MSIEFVPQYTEQLKTLLPPGSALTRAPGSILVQLMEALAFEPARVHARIFTLMDEADPRATTDLLADWEASAGLPDPCVTVAQTVAERRTALVARLTATGGASAAYFVGIAESLGYVGPTVDEPQLHVWRLNVHEATAVTWARAGSARCGDSIRSWGDRQLECTINRLKPAHTRALFAYGVP